MCLELTSKNAKFKIAKTDITCYKILTKILKIDSSIKDGDEFTAIINNIPCSGRISINNTGVFFCTNNPMLDGEYALNKYGYEYSWYLDNTVSSVIINNKESILISGLKTFYQNFPVEIGKTYESKFSKIGNEIHEGLHSFKDPININDGLTVSVECIIPKGSKYYEGKFNKSDSYASDKLTYVKIIEYCSK